MQDQDRIAHLTARILLWSAERVVMQVGLRQPLAGLELEVLDYEGAFLRRIVGSIGHKRCAEQHEDCAPEFHFCLLYTAILQIFAVCDRFSKQYLSNFSVLLGLLSGCFSGFYLFSKLNSRQFVRIRVRSRLVFSPCSSVSLW